MGIIFMVLVTQGSLGTISYLGAGLIRLLSILVDFYWWSTLLLVIAALSVKATTIPRCLCLMVLSPLMTPLRNILSGDHWIFAHGADPDVHFAASATKRLRLVRQMRTSTASVGRISPQHFRCG